MATIQIRLSGGQNNTNPKASLGGQRSNTSVTSDSLENLFDNISRTEALLARTEYRCFYVWNNTGSTATNVRIELSSLPTISTVSLGLDTAGKGDGRNTGVAQTIASEETTPSNVKFFSEDTASSDGPYSEVVLPIGLLNAGEGVPVWMKRVSEKGDQQTLTFNLDVLYETATLPGEDFDDGGAIGEFFSASTQQVGTFLIGTAKVGFTEL